MTKEQQEIEVELKLIVKDFLLNQITIEFPISEINEEIDKIREKGFEPEEIILTMGENIGTLLGIPAKLKLLPQNTKFIKKDIIDCFVENRFELKYK